MVIITTKENNNEKHFYMIKNFQIPYEDYILLNKTYDYIKSDLKINVKFSCNFSTYEKLPKGVRFRIQILDDNDITYSQDKNYNIKYNDDFTFEMNFNIDKYIKNPVIQFFILEEYIEYFVPGEIFLNGYYFRDCELYIMYKIDYNNKIFPKNIKELNTPFKNKSNNFKLDSIKSLIDYFNKLKK